MSCDRCGLDDPDCQCHVWELVKRVDTLEEELDNLTMIVEKISSYIVKFENEI